MILSDLVILVASRTRFRSAQAGRAGKGVPQMLEMFNMKNSKPVSTPLVGHFKLSKRLCPSTEKEKVKFQSFHTHR